jgi:hypothetical protein
MIRLTRNHVLLTELSGFLLLAVTSLWWFFGSLPLVTPWWAMGCLGLAALIGMSHASYAGAGLVGYAIYAAVSLRQRIKG